MRKENFERLLATYDQQKDFCLATGVTPSSVSQILQGKRSLGDGLVRRIELALGFEAGWFDKEHDKIERPAEELVVTEDMLIFQIRQALSAVDPDWDLLSGHPLRTNYGTIVPDFLIIKDDKRFAIEFKQRLNFSAVDSLIAESYKLKQLGYGLIVLHNEQDLKLEMLGRALESDGILTKMFSLNGADSQALKRIFEDISQK